MMNKKILITGSAGFIGFHLVMRCIRQGFEVYGLDKLTDYYGAALKHDRLKEQGIDYRSIREKNLLKSSLFPNYHFVQADLADFEFVTSFMEAQRFDYVVNLAAQAGVRYSLENPRIYMHSNMNGFLSILEGCRNSEVAHLVYASTSSVYGLNTRMPLHEDDPTEHPITLYAASKKSNELMAHAYSHLFNIPATGLRFFTVYGPWGRPDMALYKFTQAIIADEPITVFNYGNMVRDFTYVDDIVESIVRLLPKAPAPDPSWSGEQPRISASSAPYRIFNIGNSAAVQLNTYIEAIEKALGKKATRINMEIQPGDVPATLADVSALEELVGFRPNTSVEEGVQSFVDWFRWYHQV